MKRLICILFLALLPFLHYPRQYYNIVVWYSDDRNVMYKVPHRDLSYFVQYHLSSSEVLSIEIMNV